MTTNNCRASELRLVVFSGVSHHQSGTLVVAHGGFVREIDIWARIFREIVVLALVSSGGALADAIPYTQPNVSFISLGTVFDSSGVVGKIKRATLVGGHMKKAWWNLRPADVIMARGPDGTGFLAWIITRITHHVRFAKYADQWSAFPDEPLGYRMQKLAYGSPTFGGPVLIYGNADVKRPHLVPSVTASLSASEWENAQATSKGRKWAAPFLLLFVGRLVRPKGVDILLHTLERLLTRHIDVHLSIVGDGPERGRLAALTSELGITESVTFHGWVDRSMLISFYSRAHCFVHCSRKEGFGKVLLEAMAYSCPIVGTDVGVSRLLLEPPRCGRIVQPDDAASLEDAVVDVLNDQVRAEEMGSAARAKASGFVLEQVEVLFRSFVRNYLGLDA